MRKKLALAMFMLFISHAVYAQAWQVFSNAKILSVVQWMGNGPILIELAPNSFCSINPEDKTNIALVLTLYSSGRRADFYCFPTAVTMGGIPAYPMHRINAR